jgi:hypothetical protein
MKYTVVGIYSDSQQPWMIRVESTSPRRAAIKGIKAIYNDGKNGSELEDLFVVEVLEGNVFGVLSNDVVISLKDLKSKDCPWIH